jgi:hypothetical protein
MPFGLAGLLHFVRNDGILNSRHCNEALAASAARPCRCDNQRLASLLAYNQPLGNRFVVAWWDG